MGGVNFLSVILDILLMKFNAKPRFVHFMPLISGGFNVESGIYRESQSISIQFETKLNNISKVLPDCYKPTERTVVSASFSYNNGVDFMAGGGYNIGSISVPAKFQGEEDNVEGSYVVVMYEDKTYPIILGREFLGVPKVYGDISPVKILPDGRIRCEVSVWGHLLFGIEVELSSKLSDQVIESMNKDPSGGSPMLGYKYIPSIDGPPDCAYPIATPSDSIIKEIWSGEKGRIYYGEPSWDDVGIHKNILDVIKSLKCGKVVGVSRSFSSYKLRSDAKRLV
jgi:acetoacetate decarboxylase